MFERGERVSPLHTTTDTSTLLLVGIVSADVNTGAEVYHFPRGAPLNIEQRMLQEMYACHSVKHATTCKRQPAWP